MNRTDIIYATVIVILVAIALVGLIVTVQIDVARDRDDFYACLADGRKAYECRAILRRRGPDMIVIPSVPR